jgi:hypothetical protein
MQMAKTKSKREPLYDGTWSVENPDGERILITHDLFDAMDLLKKQAPGAKLFRDGDEKWTRELISYTSGYKLPEIIKV